MKIKQIPFVIVLLYLLLSGCATITGYPDRSENVEGELKQLEKYIKPEIIETYENEKDLTNKRILRNEIVNARIRAIDIHFNSFQQRLYGEGIGSNIATDWAVVGLSAAGAVVSSLGTSQILSAISGGITGAKSSFDKNAFFDRTMPAILTQMIALRKSALVKIRSGLTKGADEYPLNQALTDVEEYFTAGTMPGAIIGIAEEAGATAKEADNELKILLSPRTEESVAPERQQRVDQILSDINNLSDQGAFELNKNPPVKDIETEDIIKLRDPTNKRFIDGHVAREMLKMRVVLSKRSNKDLDAWEAALKAQ